METAIIQGLNGITWAMVLFLLASGFTIIYGQMRIVNIAQGSYYLLGAYAAISLAAHTGNFWLAALVSSLLVGALGLVTEFVAIRPLYEAPLYQILLTFGMMLVIGEMAKIVWGTIPLTLDPPALLRGRIEYAGVMFTRYRLAVILFGCVVAVSLWLVYVKTTLGAVLRAIVDDRQMAAGLGIDIQRVGMVSFAAGAALAALGGIAAAPIIAVYPGADLEVLLYAFAVVIIGGAGSLKGAFVASLLVGVFDVVAKGVMPELSRFTIFGLMAVVLTVKPVGLFGRG